MLVRERTGFMWGERRIQRLGMRCDLCGCSISCGYRGDEPISAARDSLKETWIVRIVVQDLADLPDGGVDAIVGIDEDFLAPNPLHDLFAGDKFAVLLQQELKNLHRYSWKFQRAARLTQLIGPEIKFKIVGKSEEQRRYTNGGHSLVPSDKWVILP